MYFSNRSEAPLIMAHTSCLARSKQHLDGVLADATDWVPARVSPP